MKLLFATAAVIITALDIISWQLGLSKFDPLVWSAYCLTLWLIAMLIIVFNVINFSVKKS